MITADEVGRSVRGAAAILNRRPDALAAFDMSPAAFRRSFKAIVLTAPAYVVQLALVRDKLGLLQDGRALFDDPFIAGLVGLGHVTSFLALPLVMAWFALRFGFADRYIPFVVVTNWIAVIGAFVLAVPSTLMLAGIETPQLTALFTTAFAGILLFVQWQAALITLRTGPVRAGLVAGLGLLVSAVPWALVYAIA